MGLYTQATFLSVLSRWKLLFPLRWYTADGVYERNLEDGFVANSHTRFQAFRRPDPTLLFYRSYSL